MIRQLWKERRLCACENRLRTAIAAYAETAARPPVQYKYATEEMRAYFEALDVGRPTQEDRLYARQKAVIAAREDVLMRAESLPAPRIAPLRYVPFLTPWRRWRRRVWSRRLREATAARDHTLGTAMKHASDTTYALAAQWWSEILERYSAKVTYYTDAFPRAIAKELPYG